MKAKDGEMPTEEERKKTWKQQDINMLVGKSGEGMIQPSWPDLSLWTGRGGFSAGS